MSSKKVIVMRSRKTEELSVENGLGWRVCTGCYLQRALYFAISQLGLSDPGVSDGGLSSGGLSDGGLSSGRPLSSGRLSDEGLSDEGLSDEGLSDEGLSDEGLSEEGLLDGRLLLAADTVENTWSSGVTYDATATNAKAIMSIFLCLANDFNSLFISVFLSI